MKKHLLPNLNYKYDALEPYIDAKTMEIHHTKHHQTYVNELNIALEKYPKLFDKKVDELIKNINEIPEDIRIDIKNHGGGHLNHSFFWEIMTPYVKNKEMKGEIIEEINKKFGNVDKFKEEFKSVAMKRFGSGWVWLVLTIGECYSPDGGKTFVESFKPTLSIISTANQDSPLLNGMTPILGLDIWEHAYYLKWQSNRKGYIENWWNVVNWTRVNEIFNKAIK